MIINLRKLEYWKNIKITWIAMATGSPNTNALLIILNINTFYRVMVLSVNFLSTYLSIYQFQDLRWWKWLLLFIGKEFGIHILMKKNIFTTSDLHVTHDPGWRLMKYDLPCFNHFSGFIGHLTVSMKNLL